VVAVLDILPRTRVVKTLPGMTGDEDTDARLITRRRHDDSDLQLSSQNEKGNTALHYAMEFDFEEITDFLVNTAQADTSIKNSDGRNCYYYAL
jgi:ankyrin repeat protein